MLTIKVKYLFYLGQLVNFRNLNAPKNCDNKLELDEYLVNITVVTLMQCAEHAFIVRAVLRVR